MRWEIFRSMSDLKKRLRNWMIATIFRSEERVMGDEWEWIEWKRRAFLRLALGVWLALAMLVIVKLVADHTQGGRYDAWGEAISSARREAGR